MDAKKLQELMDCCRPDHDDLAAPELRALSEALSSDAEVQAQWARAQRQDKLLRAAIHHVPTPHGLADRIADAVAQHQETARRADPDRLATVHGVADRAPRFGRRRWAAIAAGICAAAAAVAIAVWFGPWNHELRGVQIARMARGWVGGLDREAWQQRDAALDEYPLDPSLRFASVRWQRFAALDDRQAVAYRATLRPDSSAAFLLVVRTHRPAVLPTTPPMVPQSTTEGLCIGIWKSRGLLYVLVVPGSRAQYRRAINTQSFVMRPRLPASPGSV